MGLVPERFPSLSLVHVMVLRCLSVLLLLLPILSIILALIRDLVGAMSEAHRSSVSIVSFSFLFPHL